jgi:hypothetical protein
MFVAPHIRTLASVIMDIVYGLKIDSMDNEYIKAIIETLPSLQEIRTPGKFWLDFMPWLKHIPVWMPGATTVQFAAYWRPRVEKMINAPFDTIVGGSVSDV